MPATEMIVGLSAGLFMLLAFIHFLRLINAWLVHRTIRTAIERDSALGADLVTSLGGEAPAGFSWQSDDRLGMILIALGIATIGFSLVVSDSTWIRYGIGGALFPLLVGVALYIRHRTQRAVD